MTELSLTVNRRINAPAQKVFDAWLDPKMLARFMIPGEGGSVPKAETDAKVGGRFHIVMMSGGEEIPHSGTYKSIDPHKQIVFSWESPFSADGSMVTLNFKPAGEAPRTLSWCTKNSPASRAATATRAAGPPFSPSLPKRLHKRLRLTQIRAPRGPRAGSCRLPAGPAATGRHATWTVCAAHRA